MAERLTVPVRGMHCAACVGKVEEALTLVPGVETATVNLATERATVVFDPARADLGTLQAAVAAAGYELAAAPVPPGAEAAAAEQAAREREQEQLRRRFVVGAALSAPLLVGGMPEVFDWAPAWLRDPWLQLVLATPVQFWVGASFHAGFFLVTYGLATTAELEEIAAAWHRWAAADDGWLGMLHGELLIRV